MNSALMVFGWLILASAATWVSVIAFCVVRMALNFTGRLNLEAFIISVIAILLICVAYYSSPFQLTMTVAGQ